MASENAKNVAIEVLETVRKGQKVKLGKIIKNNGYAKTTSTVPSQVTKTKSYQDIINPVVIKWEKQREKLTKALDDKDLDKESMRDILSGIDTLTKNIQLLSGKETERGSFIFKVTKYEGD